MEDNQARLLEQAVARYEKTGQVTVFRSQSKHANMTVDHFTVPQISTLLILDIYKLPKDKQEHAVNKLVDRTPDWLDKDSDEQNNLIKTTLMQESVAYYLYTEGIISADCSMYENALDADGNIIVDAYYVETTYTKDEIRRMQKEKLKKSKKIIPFKKKAGK